MDYVKIFSRFLRYISVLLVIVFGIITILASGGGDNNGDNGATTEDSKWDSMVWDRDEWE